MINDIILISIKDWQKEVDFKLQLGWWGAHLKIKVPDITLKEIVTIYWALVDGQILLGTLQELS